ncbi:MAG: hypothetical protein HRF45_02760 [Fimbriimonadia bacterium]|jgi:hypothetical protein
MDWEERSFLTERLWSNALATLGLTAGCSAVAGVVGVLLVMLVMRRGFSGLEGFAHIAVTAPLSSAVMGAVLWVLTWLVVNSMTSDALRPGVMREIAWGVVVLVMALQAFVWALFIRHGVQ